ncbi:MAG TPA: DUF2191 domain-containing protein [Opitutaceae bacterium]|nr:DUF2191 domain-containing protein [Opitutaceae bacterium]
MRITIDIPEDILNELLKETGETKMSPAVSKAAQEYLRRLKAARFGRLIREGAFDYGSVNEDIEKSDR